LNSLSIFPERGGFTHAAMKRVPMMSVGAVLVVGMVARAFWRPLDNMLFHILPTYPDVPGYPVSRLVGHAFRHAYAGEVAELERQCNTAITEVWPGGDLDLKRLYDAEWPFILRNGFKPDAASTIKVLGDTHQNLYTPCQKEPHIMHMETKPCINYTLEQKFQETVRVMHAKGSKAFAHPRTINSEELKLAYEGFKDSLQIPRHISRFMGIDNGYCVTNTLLAIGNKTAVESFHAHPDRVIALNMQGSKRWELLPPHYATTLDPVWTGNALMMTTKPTTKCVVKFEQHPGDVFVQPPWWWHQTRRNDYEDVSVAFNEHTIPYDNTFGVIALGLQILIGRERFFQAVSEMVTPSSAFFELVMHSMSRQAANEARMSLGIARSAVFGQT